MGGGNLGPESTTMNTTFAPPDQLNNLLLGTKGHQNPSPREVTPLG